MSNYLVTGANGFVGQALLAHLCASGHRVRAVHRAAPHGEPGAAARACDAHGERLSWVPTATDFVDLAEHWPSGLPCDVAIHLAARVHVMSETKGAKHAGDAEASALLALYRETNVQGSLRVARAAKRAGATRFVFVSSVKAMGDQEPGSPPHAWRESDPPAPGDAYGVTKREAELALARFCAANGMALVVVRPPLVYGPGVRANFRQLMQVVARRLPLPLASVTARRSMIFVDNLVDALATLAEHRHAADRIFNVSDGDDLCVARIATLLGEAMERPVRLLSVPPTLLSFAARVAGRAEQADRLLQPLRLDIEAVRAAVAWRPPYTVNEGLRQTAIWYRDAILKKR